MRTEAHNLVPVVALTAGLKPLRLIIHQSQRSARRGLTATNDVNIMDLETRRTAGGRQCTRCLAGAVVTTIAENAGRCVVDTTYGGGDTTPFGCRAHRGLLQDRLTLSSEFPRPLSLPSRKALEGKTTLLDVVPKILRGETRWLNVPTEIGTVGNASA